VGRELKGGFAAGRKEKMSENVKTMELFRGTGGAIVKKATLTSDAIDMSKLRLNGNFSLHMINTGGTVTVTVLVCSTLKGTFVAPSVAVTVISAGAAGTHFTGFSPPLAPFIKLLFTETDVATVTAMDAWLNYQ